MDYGNSGAFDVNAELFKYNLFYNFFMLSLYSIQMLKQA
jgi:hypothetical protein